MGVKPSREMIIKAIEAKDLYWCNLNEGESPYSQEDILVFSGKEVVKGLRGFKEAGQGLYIWKSSDTFGGQTVFLKKVCEGWQAREGYTSRGHTIKVWRVFIGELPEQLSDKNYTAYEAVDLSTMRCAEENGYRVLTLGCKLHLVEKGALSSLSGGLNLE